MLSQPRVDVMADYNAWKPLGNDTAFVTVVNVYNIKTEWPVQRGQRHCAPAWRSAASPMSGVPRHTRRTARA